MDGSRRLSRLTRDVRARREGAAELMGVGARLLDHAIWRYQREQ
jgi:hypothetical protein